jgi:hypothetical protein
LGVAGDPVSNPLRVLRRLSALLLGLLFLQLTLLRDGGSCRTHGSAGTSARTGAMAMANAPHDRAPVPDDGCGAERSASDCGSMPSCATVLATPVTVVALVQLASPAQALPQPASIHSQPATGPAVPPPRG